MGWRVNGMSLSSFSNISEPIIRFKSLKVNGGGGWMFEDNDDDDDGSLFLIAP